MKKLMISGNSKEVKEIIHSLIERYGNIKITELISKFNKDKLTLC